MIRAVCQGRVIERAIGLGDTHRLTAHLQHQRRPDRISDLVGSGDAEAGPGQPSGVVVGAARVDDAGGLAAGGVARDTLNTLKWPIVTIADWPAAYAGACAST